jgi:hypothetical protein
VRSPQVAGWPDPPLGVARRPSPLIAPFTFVIFFFKLRAFRSFLKLSDDI